MANDVHLSVPKAWPLTHHTAAAAVARASAVQSGKAILQQGEVQGSELDTDRVCCVADFFFLFVEPAESSEGGVQQHQGALSAMLSVLCL